MIAAPAGDGRTSFVSRDDLADVAAAVLLRQDTDLDGQALEVTGPEALTMAEAAEVLTEITGRPVTYRDQTVEEAWATRRPSGHPDWEIEGWVTSYLAIAAGELSTVTDVVPTADRAPGAHRRRAPARPPRGLGAPALDCQRRPIRSPWPETVGPGPRPAGARAAPTTRAPRTKGTLAGFIVSSRAARVRRRGRPPDQPPGPLPEPLAACGRIDAEEVEARRTARAAAARRRPAWPPRPRLARPAPMSAVISPGMVGSVSGCSTAAVPGQRHIATATGRPRRTTSTRPAARYCSANRPKSAAQVVRRGLVVREEPAHQRVLDEGAGQERPGLDGGQVLHGCSLSQVDPA